MARAKVEEMVMIPEVEDQVIMEKVIAMDVITQVESDPVIAEAPVAHLPAAEKEVAHPRPLAELEAQVIKKNGLG